MANPSEFRSCDELPIPATYTDEEIEDMFDRMATPEEIEAERAFERLAAFGPDVKVIDVITGEAFVTPSRFTK